MAKKLLGVLMLPLALAMVAACSDGGGDAPLSVTAPWADEERTTYVIQNRQGAQIGTGDLQVKREGDVYVLRQVYALPGGTKDEITMRVRADDLKPLEGHREVTTSKGVTTIQTSYRDGKLAIKARTPEGEDKSAEIGVPADAYDNDQALFLWRALPMGDGYKTGYTNVVAANALKPRVAMTVMGKETVTAPAGEFESWKMEMDFGQQKQYAWYTVAPPHYLVKYDNGATIFFLEKQP